MVRYKGESYEPGDPEYPRLVMLMLVWASGIGAGIGIFIAIFWVAIAYL